jgi:hypothetical protein
MTTQEINNERNKEISLMLGAIYSEPAKAWGFGNARIEPNELKFGGEIIKGAVWAERFEKELKFHSDWNWLMEAVEFIESIKINDIQIYNVKIWDSHCEVKVNPQYALTLEELPVPIWIIQKTKKEATFVAVSDFAKLYNNKEI